MDAGEDDTETKLAILHSLFESLPTSDLLSVLIDCDGDINRTIDKFNSRQTKVKVQRGIRSFLQKSPKKRKLNGCLSSKPRSLNKKDHPQNVLHLYTPEDVEAHLPSCTLYQQFLPSKLADSLLKTLLDQSPRWTTPEFYLFERKVSSPHRTQLYIPREKMPEASGFMYQARSLTPLPFFSEMDACAKMVNNKVNDDLKSRKRYPYQAKGTWKTCAAVCNLYKDGSQSVGYHSDQLTYLGPHPIIGSISLGVTREFRLKPRLSSWSGPTYSIHLPHNSLLVMHSSCQEAFKHSLVPVGLSKGFDRHPVSGTSRINITYRMYRSEFSPETIPKCKCGITMMLRTTMAGVSSTNTEDIFDYVDNCNINCRYFWTCAGAYKNGKGCSDTFIPAIFDEEGPPPP